MATLFGIAIGPYGGNLFDARTVFEGHLNVTTLEFARLVMGIQCLAAGIQLPWSFIYHERQTLMILFGPVMVGMWLVSTAIVYGVMGLPLTDSLVIAACITPTDPVLCSSIVKGAFADEHIPRYLRDVLSAESGANDGLALPFLLLPIYLTRFPSWPAGLGSWFLNAILYQILLSIVVAIIVGYFARKLLKMAQDSQWTDNETIVGFSLSLALFVLGFLSMLGISDVLGCFVVGLVFSWDGWFNEQVKESHIQEVLDSILNVVFFVFVGIRIPWGAVNSLPGVGKAFGHNVAALWQLMLAVVLILLFRRLPVVLAMKPFIPALHDWSEAVFCGWFGPIGAGAIFYAMVAIEALALPEEPILAFVSLCVFGSILVHGGSVGLFHIGLVYQRTLEFRNAIRHSSPRLECIDPSSIVVLHNHSRVNDVESNINDTDSQVNRAEDDAIKDEIAQSFEMNSLDGPVIHTQDVDEPVVGTVYTS
ncbi:hypothetical protein HDV03_002530 [Kappamyces sp. JEL0829]|nr:hypothetical protein HDV03_002530 [Kappamyces sp. JEL0829]